MSGGWEARNAVTQKKNDSRTMTNLSQLGPPITGKLHSEEVEHESDHFYLGSTGGKDARDLRQVIWHDQPRHESLELNS